MPFFASTKHLEPALPPNIPTTKPNINPHLPVPNNPRLRVHAPITEIPAHERESHGLGLSRLEGGFFETAQDFDGSHVTVGGRGEAEVELRDRGAGGGACVCDDGGDGVEGLPEGGVAAGGWDGGGGGGGGGRTVGGDGGSVVCGCDGDV